DVQALHPRVVGEVAGADPLPDGLGDPPVEGREVAGPAAVRDTPGEDLVQLRENAVDRVAGPGAARNVRHAVSPCRSYPKVPGSSSRQPAPRAPASRPAARSPRPRTQPSSSMPRRSSY